MRSILALITILAAASSAPAEEDITTGGFWLRNCKHADDLCVGYIQALRDLNWVNETIARPIWCIPPQATNDQLVKVIVRSLEDDPAHLHLPFIALAHRALQQSFPCSPDTAAVGGGK